MSITVRDIQPSDRARLEAVLRSDKSFTEAEIAVALELVDLGLDGDSPDYWFHIATDGPEVAGYICFGPTPMTASTYDLYWIVCHRGFRGQGVARRLIEAMEASLRQRSGTAAIRVETGTKESHEAARKLYAALGYPEAGRFEDFYAPGDDLLVYYKRLASS
jgi:ribosomal protein S18 acetylase RimI-like enzyme